MLQRDEICGWDGKDMFCLLTEQEKLTKMNVSWLLIEAEANKHCAESHDLDVTADCTLLRCRPKPEVCVLDVFF